MNVVEALDEEATWKEVPCLTSLTWLKRLGRIVSFQPERRWQQGDVHVAPEYAPPCPSRQATRQSS